MSDSSLYDTNSNTYTQAYQTAAKEELITRLTAFLSIMMSWPDHHVILAGPFLTNNIHHADLRQTLAAGIIYICLTLMTSLLDYDDPDNWLYFMTHACWPLHPRHAKHTHRGLRDPRYPHSAAQHWNLWKQFREWFNSTEPAPDQSTLIDAWNKAGMDEKTRQINFLPLMTQACTCLWKGSPDLPDDFDLFVPPALYYLHPHQQPKHRNHPLCFFYDLLRVSLDFMRTTVITVPPVPRDHIFLQAVLSPLQDLQMLLIPDTCGYLFPTRGIARASMEFLNDDDEQSGDTDDDEQPSDEENDKQPSDNEDDAPPDDKESDAQPGAKDNDQPGAKDNDQPGHKDDDGPPNEDGSDDDTKHASTNDATMTDASTQKSIAPPIDALSIYFSNHLYMQTLLANTPLDLNLASLVFEYTPFLFCVPAFGDDDGPRYPCPGCNGTAGDVYFCCVHCRGEVCLKCDVERRPDCSALCNTNVDPTWKGCVDDMPKKSLKRIKLLYDILDYPLPRLATKHPWYSDPCSTCRILADPAPQTTIVMMQDEDRTSSDPWGTAPSAASVQQGSEVPSLYTAPLGTAAPGSVPAQELPPMANQHLAWLRALSRSGKNFQTPPLVVPSSNTWVTENHDELPKRSFHRTHGSWWQLSQNSCTLMRDNELIYPLPDHWTFDTRAHDSKIPASSTSSANVSIATTRSFTNAGQPATSRTSVRYNRPPPTGSSGPRQIKTQKKRTRNFTTRHTRDSKRHSSSSASSIDISPASSSTNASDLIPSDTSPASMTTWCDQTVVTSEGKQAVRFRATGLCSVIHDPASGAPVNLMVQLVARAYIRDVLNLRYGFTRPNIPALTESMCNLMDANQDFKIAVRRATAQHDVSTSTTRSAEWLDRILQLLSSEDASQ
jgi:hypothetical protein